MDKKVGRIISLYNRVVDGEVLVKADEAARYGVNEKSIQRDINDIRAYFSNDPESNRELVYDRRKKGYVLVQNTQKALTNSEILTVCKILLESRSLTKAEMYPIIDKLLQCCVPYKNYRQVSELIGNEKFHYLEPHHGKKFVDDMWDISSAVYEAGNQEVMLSVMYALLEALSSVLDIERNDIKGCLHKVVYDNKLIYAIVLYDAVAGGAGHVRRLVTEDGLRFRQVVEKAIAITKGCNCSPSCYSCLRNYYNQKIHDLLNRKYAYDFLENYSGDLEPITNEEFEGAEEPERYNRQ